MLENRPQFQRLEQPCTQVIIPALNEAGSIAAVVSGLLAQDQAIDGVIVVDNGSTDGTGDRAREAGAIVVREERRGYGYACYAGVLAAREADLIVLLDGDAAENPADLKQILQPALGGQADLVVGSRSAGRTEHGAMNSRQVFGNRLTTWLIRRLYGVNVTDLAAFRCIRRDALLAFDMQQMTYGWSVEMVVKAARAGLRYREVPITYQRRIGESKVSGNLKTSLRAGWCMLSTPFRYLRWSPMHADERAACRLSSSS